MTLYNLIFTDNELDERFNIGFFSTSEKAEQTAQYYKRNVRGFCEYDCSYSITEKNVVGNAKSGSVFIVYGWNEYDRDVVESDCFATEPLARRSLAEMKSVHIREEWCVDCYYIDECKWTDGFVRV